MQTRIRLLLGNTTTIIPATVRKRFTIQARTYSTSAMFLASVVDISPNTEASIPCTRSHSISLSQRPVRHLANQRILISTRLLLFPPPFNGAGDDRT